MTREQFYGHLPWPVQLVAVNYHGWQAFKHRFNRQFFSLFDDYLSRTDWSAQQLRDYRDQRVLEFVRWAETNVPFYAERFRKVGFSAVKQNNLDGFDRVPVLDKSTVQENYATLAVDVNEPTLKVHTSGSTGAGLQFRTTYSAYREQWACWQRYRHWHGIGINEPCAYFGGRSIVSSSQQRPPYWRKCWTTKQLMFSAYHLSSRTAKSYISALERFRTRWIHGYPSFVALLASYLLEQSKSLEMKWVTLGAENVTPRQRKLIEMAFGVSPIDHYGMAEAISNFSQWPDGVRRVDEDFSYTEFLTRSDGSFDVIGTNFSNRAFPLIRYKVGDVVELPGNRDEETRFGRVVSQIYGRDEDYVITKDGARLGRLDHIFKDCVHLREAQIVQNRIGEVMVNIVPYSKFSPVDEKLLVDALRQRFGNRIDFYVRCVESVPKTSRGKLRLVVSEVAGSRIDVDQPFSISRANSRGAKLEAACSEYS